MSETTLQTFNDTSSKTMNETISSFTLHRVLILSSFIVSLLGLAGNGVVIWFLGFRIKRNPITVYILNLAVADIVLLISQSIWLFFMHSAVFVVVLMSSREVVLNSFTHIFIFAFRTSILFLTAISMERCIAVVCPIWYKCRRPKHLSTIICFCIWVLAFAETMFWLFLCTISHTANIISHCNSLISSFSLISFGVVSPLMILSSLLLIIQVRKKSIKRQPKRLYRAILLNLLVFLICTFPARLVLFLTYHHVIQLPFYDYSLTVLFDDFLISINSSANPFIYFLVGRDKKRKSAGSIMVALQRVFGNDTGVTGQDETPNPPVNRTVELQLPES